MSPELKETFKEVSRKSTSRNDSSSRKEYIDSPINAFTNSMSPEEVKMSRINANYEHDKAVLAKSAPVFAKNQFWDVGGVVSAINDIQDARLEYHKSWSDLKLTEEQIDLIDSMDVNDSAFQYLTACVSAEFIIFDVIDTVKACNLIGKCNSFDDATRLALKQSKRYGEKAFQNIDIPMKRKL